MMNWIDFKSEMFDLGCFSVHQVFAWKPGFDRNNFVRWTKKGYLVRLRRGIYAFSDYLGKPEMAIYLAGKIYSPSYISLHTALSFYGLIPETVVQITSVTSLKTARFSNKFAEYSYKSVRSDLMCGFAPRKLRDGRTAMYATREKALLDLLYLYPFYNNEAELSNLRLDRDVLHEDLNPKEMESYMDRFHSLELEKRRSLLFKVYDL